MAGRTPFVLALTNCPTGKSVNVYFEPGTNVDPNTGNLVNNGTASNVEVGLLDSNFNLINITTEPTSGPASTIQSLSTTKNSSVSINYYAEYIATGQVSAGDVSALVNYSLVYQ